MRNSQLIANTLLIPFEHRSAIPEWKNSDHSLSSICSSDTERKPLDWHLLFINLQIYKTSVTLKVIDRAKIITL